MADARIEVEIAAKLENFGKNLNVAIESIENFDTRSTGASRNIISSIDEVNSKKITEIVAPKEHEALTNLSNALKLIGANATLFGDSLTAQKQAISAYRVTINQLIADGYSPASKKVVELADKVNNLSASLERQEKFAKSQADKLAASFQKPVGIIGNLENSLASLRVKLSQATDTKSIENYNKAIAVLQSQLSGLRTKGVENASAILGTQLTNSSNRAGFALLNLGRVAQDLPYGFMGIQNNLNPLLESFQALRRESGSNALALKALASSLMGGAGIGLALSVVTAAISFATMGMTYWKARTGSAKKATEDYVDTLNNLDKAHLKGGQNAQKEVVQLDLLYKATQNTTLSIQERKKAVDKLQDLYPAYFKNISDEKILTGEAKDAYDRLKDSLIAVARARAGQELILENQRTKLKNEQRITDLEQKKLDIEKEHLKTVKASSSYNPYGGSSGVGATLKTLSDTAPIQKEINDLKEENNKLVADSLALEEKINETTAKHGIKAIVDEDKGSGQKLKTVSDILKELALDLQKIDNNITLAFGDIPKKKIGEIQKAVEALQDIGLSPASDTIKGLQQQIVSLSQEPLKVKTVGITQATQELDAFSAKVEEVAIKMPGYLTDWQKALQDFSINASHIVTQGSVDIVAGFSEMLAGMATGQLTLQDLAAGLFGILGDIATQLGKAAIAIGVGMIAIKASFANPATAIAAGAALVALGSLIKQAASIPQNGGKSGDSGYSISYVPKFAKGGVVSGPTLAMVGEYPGASSDPEVISPLSKLKSMIKDTSSGSTQVMIPELRISGQDMLVVFRRAERADKRGT